MSALTRTRRECNAIGSGSCQILETGSDAVLGPRFEDAQSTVIVLNNFAGKRHTVTLDLSERERDMATDLIGDRRYATVHAETGRLRLESNV